MVLAAIYNFFEGPKSGNSIAPSSRYRLSGMLSPGDDYKRPGGCFAQ